MTQAFLPCSRPEIDESTIAAVSEVLRSGWITGGPKVKEFETVLSKYLGGRLVRTFISGTSALEVALRVLGIGPGDEVITTPISWVATSNVILAVGATPVFADIDPSSHNIDLIQVRNAITPKTRVIIPVHLAGLPVDMDHLYSLAEAYNLRVIEDAAQAIGSTWKGKRIGSFGDLVSFSFQATKNITTGEGGCLVLNNDEEAGLAEKFRLQGVTRNGFDSMEVEVLGGKFNMADIAATIGLGQFSEIETITAKRRALAQRYFTAFGQDFNSALLPPEDTGDSNWHMFQLVLPDRWSRAAFQEHMKEIHQIGIGVHYPPIHLFRLYRERGFKEGMFPVAEQVGRQIITLPLFKSMTEADVDHVVNAIKSTLESNM